MDKPRGHCTSCGVHDTELRRVDYLGSPGSGQLVCEKCYHERKVLERAQEHTARCLSVIHKGRNSNLDVEKLSKLIGAIYSDIESYRKYRGQI